MRNENKDTEKWPGEGKGEVRDRVSDRKKIKKENNATRAAGLNDSATGSRHGVSAKLYMKHANCNIPAFLLTSVTIDTRNRSKTKLHIHIHNSENDTADMYSLL